jgi:hypothetical protein
VFSGCYRAERERTENLVCAFILSIGTSGLPETCFWNSSTVHNPSSWLGMQAERRPRLQNTPHKALFTSNAATRYC